MSGRAHLPWDDPRVDTIYVLVMAKRGPGKADMNACALADSDANCHWPDGPVKNHFTWIWTGKYDAKGREIRRRLSTAERSRPMILWTEAQYLRLRRAEYGGRKPATVEMRQRQAVRLGVEIDWELKSKQYRQPALAQRFMAALNRAGGRHAIMTLVTLRYWGQKLKAFKQAGAHKTALLPHGVRKTAWIKGQLAIYGRYIDAYWGTWA